jgi:hypothetical protein
MKVQIREAIMMMQDICSDMLHEGTDDGWKRYAAGASRKNVEALTDMMQRNGILSQSEYLTERSDFAMLVGQFYGQFVTSAHVSLKYMIDSLDMELEIMASQIGEEAAGKWREYKAKNLSHISENIKHINLENIMKRFDERGNHLKVVR